MESRLRQAKIGYNNNDPVIEVNQIWSTPVERRGDIPLRRLRVIARYPAIPPAEEAYDDRRWVMQEMPGAKMRLEIGSLRVCPELNLRYVFDLEPDDAT